jgi:hypothetical protein
MLTSKKELSQIRLWEGKKDAAPVLAPACTLWILNTEHLNVT